MTHQETRDGGGEALTTQYPTADDFYAICNEEIEK
jgi:hypothetical protein